MIDLKAVRQHLKLTQKQAAIDLNTTQSTVSKYENRVEVPGSITEKIIKAYSELVDLNQFLIDEESQEEYLTGIDDYFTGKRYGKHPFTQILNAYGNIKYTNIIHIPLSAEAGFINGGVKAVSEDELEYWSLPGFKGKGYSFVVSGESMLDTLRPGEYVVTDQEPVWNIDEIVNKSLYVIETKENILIKRLEKHADHNKIWALSDNEDFQDIELMLDNIIHIYKGRRVVSFNLSRKMRYE